MLWFLQEHIPSSRAGRGKFHSCKLRSTLCLFGRQQWWQDKKHAAQTHRETALPAVEAVLVHGHAHAHTALLVGARLAQTLHLPVVVDAVELEHRQLDRLVHVLHLLGLGVGLLLALLTTTAKAKNLFLIGELWRFQLEEGLLKCALNTEKTSFQRKNAMRQNAVPICASNIPAK